MLPRQQTLNAIVGDDVSVGDIPHSCTIGTSMRIQLLKALLEPSNLSMLDLQDLF